MGITRHLPPDRTSMPDAKRAPPTSIRRDLLASVALLFVSAVAVAVGAVAIIVPLAPSPLAALVPLAIIVLADLVILYLFLRGLLKKSVLDPVDGIVAHAERIAQGDLDHRIPPAGAEELDRIVESVNTLAGRLINEQARLAENVASLDETNRALSEASDQLVRAARLASVGTLAGGVAHEIGNPLAALRAYLDVLEGRLAQGRPVDELVQDLRHEVGRIDDIVRSILGFAEEGPGAETAAQADPEDPASVPGARRPAAQPLGAVEIGTLVDAVRQDLSRDGLLEGVEVEARIDPGAPTVHLHPQHLERVLSNLVRNAAQSGSPRVRIVVEAGALTPDDAPLRRDDDPPTANWAHRRRLDALLAGRPQGSRRGELPPASSGPPLEIRVEDEGPGIPPEHLDRVFDPFFTTREPGKGTGMGLALAARIVTEVGGSLEAANRSEGTGGAVFVVRLPGGRVG
jgi:two-component system, NtrC family, sensor kinase